MEKVGGRLPPPARSFLLVTASPSKRYHIRNIIIQNPNPKYTRINLEYKGGRCFSSFWDIPIEDNVDPLIIIDQNYLSYI